MFEAQMRRGVTVTMVKASCKADVVRAACKVAEDMLFQHFNAFNRSPGSVQDWFFNVMMRRANNQSRHNRKFMSVMDFSFLRVRFVKENNNWFATVVCDA
jgi:hypothetical protein